MPEQLIFGVIILLQLKNFSGSGIRAPPLSICFRRLWSGNYFWRLQFFFVNTWKC